MEEDEITLEERQEFSQELQKFIQDATEQVKELCSEFGFNFDKMIKIREPYMVCPFNSGHRMPQASMEKHLKKCEWNTLGYTKDCKPLPDSALSPDSPSTIKFDMELQHKVLMAAKQKNPNLNIGDEEKLIPQTSDRLMSDFTVDERRAMYDYVIANTIIPDVGQDINMDNTEKKEEKNTTIFQLLQQERNLKRRRAKYKGVHTNKKSHTEILREVIEQQMEMYKEFVSEKYDVSFPNDKKSLCTDDNGYKNEEQRSDKSDYYKNTKSLRHKNYESYNNSYPKSSKNRFESKNYHDYKNFKHHYDKDYKNYKTSHYKDNNYKNSSRDKDIQSSHRDRDEERDFQDKKQDTKDFHSKSEDKYNSHSRKRSRSRSKERKRDNSRKRSRSNEGRHNVKSKEDGYKEKKNDEKEKDSSRERKHHKKHKKEHKKEHKKKKDKSNNNYDVQSRKHSKQKHRSRSCS